MSGTMLLCFTLIFLAVSNSLGLDCFEGNKFADLQYGRMFDNSLAPEKLTEFDCSASKFQLIGGKKYRVPGELAAFKELAQEPIMRKLDKEENIVSLDLYRQIAKFRQALPDINKYALFLLQVPIYEAELKKIEVRKTVKKAYFDLPSEFKGNEEQWHEFLEKYGLNYAPKTTFGKQAVIITDNVDAETYILNNFLDLSFQTLENKLKENGTYGVEIYGFSGLAGPIKGWPEKLKDIDELEIIQVEEGSEKPKPIDQGFFETGRVEL